MENKETFDLIAQEYEKHRPTYPDKLFEDIIKYSKINRDARILEIGCGTGQATSGIIQKGYENVTCIELGESLSKLASEKFSKYKKVNVIHSSFEDWHANDLTYDLAISATAFHFIEPSFGYQKVHDLLRKNGSIGFFWTVHVQRFDELSTEIRRIYQKYAPHLDDSKKITPDEVIDLRYKEILVNGLYEDIQVYQYNQLHSFSSEEFISLLNTHSKHQQLTEHVRKQIFDKIRNTIDNYGGIIEKDHRVALFLAKKK